MAAVQVGARREQQAMETSKALETLAGFAADTLNCGDRSHGSMRTQEQGPVAGSQDRERPNFCLKGPNKQMAEGARLSSGQLNYPLKLLFLRIGQ